MGNGERTESGVVLVWWSGLGEGEGTEREGRKKGVRCWKATLLAEEFFKVQRQATLALWTGQQEGTTH